jgi:hypothetical protein
VHVVHPDSWITIEYLKGGSDRRRSGDLSIFSRTLYQLSYRAKRHGHWRE